MLHEAGKVAAVKNFMCYLLIVWMTLTAGGANALAHSSQHHGHDVFHTHDHGSLVTTSESATSQNFIEVDTDFSEKLNQSYSDHCHTHHQTAGLPSCHGMLVVMDLPTFAPVPSRRLPNIAVIDNIERPKWLLTTLAVVSLLS